jgi:hypothetical protein
MFFVETATNDGHLAIVYIYELYLAKRVYV